jgi:hypothetical protein
VTVSAIGKHRQIVGKLVHVQTDARGNVQIMQPVNVGSVHSIGSRQRQQVRAQRLQGVGNGCKMNRIGHIPRP